MPKKKTSKSIKPPKAPEFHHAIKKHTVSKFPKSRYQPLPGPVQLHNHIAAYAFIVILLSVFIIGITLKPSSLVSPFVGTAYSATADPDIDQDHCLYILDQLGGCSNICYGINYPEELSNSYNPKCCGDDALEFAKYFQVHSTGSNVFAIGENNDGTDAACCKKETDCVYNMNCYPENKVLDINGDGVKGEACKLGKWIDLDSDKSLCIAQPSMYWSTSGEDHAFGEYKTAYQSESCCGDDAGEYRKGGVYCCDSTKDTIINEKCV